MKLNQNKLGRNDVCHCGSGNKYKRCCLSLDETTPRHSQPMDNIILSKGSARLRSRVKQNLGDNCTIVQQHEIGGIKMSEAILDLADFILARAETNDEVEMAISVTCVAWNIAVLGPEKGQQFLDDYFLKVNDSIGQQDFIDIINVIIENKMTYYRDINRLILDHELCGDVNNLHLNIVSTVIEESIDGLKKTPLPIDITETY